MSWYHRLCHIFCLVGLFAVVGLCIPQQGEGVVIQLTKRYNRQATLDTDKLSFAELQDAFSEIAIEPDHSLIGIELARRSEHLPQSPFPEDSLDWHDNLGSRALRSVVGEFGRAISRPVMIAYDADWTQGLDSAGEILLANSSDGKTAYRAVQREAEALVKEGKQAAAVALVTAASLNRILPYSAKFKGQYCRAAAADNASRARAMGLSVAARKWDSVDSDYYTATRNWPFTTDRVQIMAVHRQAQVLQKELEEEQSSIDRSMEEIFGRFSTTEEIEEEIQRWIGKYPHEHQKDIPVRVALTKRRIATRQSSVSKSTQGSPPPKSARELGRSKAQVRVCPLNGAIVCDCVDYLKQTCHYLWCEGSKVCWDSVQTRLQECLTSNPPRQVRGVLQSTRPPGSSSSLLPEVRVNTGKDPYPEEVVTSNGGKSSDRAVEPLAIARCKNLLTEARKKWQDSTSAVAELQPTANVEEIERLDGVVEEMYTLVEELRRLSQTRDLSQETVDSISERWQATVARFSRQKTE